MKKLVIIAVLRSEDFLLYKQMQPTASVTTSEQSQVVNQSINSQLVTDSADNAKVYIIEPANGASVTSPVTVKFGLDNMLVAPAGDNKANSGHHHILIDIDVLPDLSQPLPVNDQIIHFGKGQTEVILQLESGQHTLQLLLGNYLHIPHSTPVISEKITITVK